VLAQFLGAAEEDGDGVGFALWGIVAGAGEVMG
jgi:hypothetical protein